MTDTITFIMHLQDRAHSVRSFVWQGAEYHYDATHTDMAFMPSATIEGKYKSFAARQSDKNAAQ